MTTGTGPTILHADLDSFYASVEQRDDPGAARPAGHRRRRASCWRPATRPRRSACGPRWAAPQARRLCPHAVVVPPRFDAYIEASKAVFAVFDDTTPLVEGMSIDEAFLDVGGLRRIAGPPTDDRRPAPRRRCASGSGWPSPSASPAPSSWPRWPAASPSPTACSSSRPDGELDFLHPLPVERLWGVGPVTTAKLHARGITTVGEVATPRRGVAGLDARGRGRAPPPRPGPQPRPAARCSAGAPSPLDRIAVGASVGPGAAGPDPGPRRRRWSASSTGSPAGCGRAEPGRPHRHAAAPLRRLHPGHPLAHASPTDRPHRRRSSPSPARSWAPPAPLIHQRGITLVGLAVANLDDADAVQLILPFDRRPADADGASLDTALDDVRSRFGTASVTRAVLLDHPGSRGDWDDFGGGPFAPDPDHA